MVRVRVNVNLIVMIWVKIIRKFTWLAICIASFLTNTFSVLKLAVFKDINTEYEGLLMYFLITSHCLS